MRLLMRCLLAACAAFVFTSPGDARDFVGLGRLLTNDSFATITDDRWRTGSGVLSLVWARDGSFQDRSPGVGDILEFRFRGDLFTPEDLVVPDRSDRPYAAALSFGLHTHFSVYGWDVSMGADLVVTGEQTLLPDLQAAIHSVIGVAEPSDAVLALQLPNNLHGSVTGEFARAYSLSDRATARPFFEVQAGVETLARVGVDLHFGSFAQETFKVRDVATGQRYLIGQTPGAGWSAVLGADIAYVDRSLFLPSSSGVELTDIRGRLRGGVHFQTERMNVFYGLTWLSKEFDSQSSGQLLGSLRVAFLF